MASTPLETEYKGKARDIIVKEPFTVIEVHNLKDAEILRESKNMLVCLGTKDSQRIKKRTKKKGKQLSGVHNSILFIGLSNALGILEDDFDKVIHDDRKQFPDNIALIIGWRHNAVEFCLKNPNKNPEEGTLAAHLFRICT